MGRSTGRVSRGEGMSRPPQVRTRSRPAPPDGYWLGGRHPVAAALADGRVRRLIVAAGATGLEDTERAARQAGVPVERVERAELERMAGSDAQGCAAWVRLLPTVSVDTLIATCAKRTPALVVACDHLQDPRNLGAIARTAVAVGAVGLLVPERRAAPVGPVVERVAAGTLQALSVAVVANLPDALERFRRARFWVYGAAADGDQRYDRCRMDPRTVLVIGAEDRGLAPLVRRHCDATLRLPLCPPVQSLNASAAAAVLLYEWARHYGDREPHD